MAAAGIREAKARARTFRKRHPMRQAALGLGLVGLAYAASSAVLGLTGNVPAAPVIAGLDADNYYALQIVFVGPLVFAVWILASGVLLALGTRGCHRSDVLVRASRAWRGPLLLAWSPMAVRTAFAALGMGQAEWVEILSRPGIWQTIFVGIYAAAGLWSAARFVGAARTVHKKSWPAAIATGSAAAALAAGLFVLFVR